MNFHEAVSLLFPVCACVSFYLYSLVRAPIPHSLTRTKTAAPPPGFRAPTETA